MISGANTRYHSYLIRLWATSSHEKITWQIMLENPSTKEKFAFNQLEEVLVFLQAEMDADYPIDKPEEID